MPDLFEQIDAADQARQSTDLFAQIDAADAERENDPLFKAIDLAASEKRIEDLKRIPGAQTAANLIGAGARAVKRVQQFATVAPVFPDLATITKTGAELDTIEAEKDLPDEQVRPGSTEDSARKVRGEVEDIIASVRSRVPADQQAILDRYAPTPDELDALEESQRQKVRNVIEAERAPAIARTIPQLIKMAEQETAIRQIPLSEARKVFDSSEGVKDTLLSVIQNPSVNLELILEGAITGSPAILGGVVGGILAGPEGGATGAALGAFGVEYVASLSDELARRGVDATDPEAIKAEILKPGFFDAVEKRGVSRGIPVAIASAIGGLLGGRAIARSVTAGKGTVLAALQEGGEQMVVQAGGEAAAQVSAGDKLDPKEIYAEAVGSAGEAVRAIVQGGVQRAQAGRKAVTGVVEKANTPVDTLREVGQVQEDMAQQAKRARDERVQADVKVAQAEEQVQAAARQAQTASELSRLEALAEGVIEQTNQNLQPVEVPPAITQAEETNAETIARGAPERGQEEGVGQGTDRSLRLRDDEATGETQIPERADEAAPRVELPPQPTIDVIHASAEEVSQWADSIRQYENRIPEIVFGEEMGKKWQTLQRRANSVMNPEAADKAFKEQQEIEATLTPEQERLLYGDINDGVPYTSPEQARDFATYITEIELAESLSEMVSLTSRGIRDAVVKAKDGGTLSELESALLIRSVRKAKQLGATQDQFFTELLKRRSVFEGADAAELLGITWDEALKVAERAAQPTPEATTLPDTGQTAPQVGQEPSTAVQARVEPPVDLSDAALEAAERSSTEPDDVVSVSKTDPPPYSQSKRPFMETGSINDTTWFHGTRTPGITPETVSSTFTSIEGLFGSGFYMTDDPSVAQSYASRRGDGFVYRFNAKPRNVLNFDQALPQDAVQIIEDSVDSQFKDVVQEAAAKEGATGSSIWRALTDAIADESQGEQVPISEYVEMFQNLEGNLREAGYDAITHRGGTRAGKSRKLHQVLILLDPSGEYRAPGTENVPILEQFRQPQQADLSDQALNAAEAQAPTKRGVVRGTALEQWADQQITDGGQRLSGGLDPLQAFAYAVKGAALLEQGVRDFAVWSAEMGKRYANLTAEQIASLWAQANQIASDLAAGRKVEVPQREQAAATPSADTVQAPPPQTPATEPEVPTPPPGQGVRRLAQRVITDEAQPREVRQQLAENPEIFYEKFSNDALMEAAQEASDEELVQMRNNGDERVAAHALIEQANRLSETGDAQEAADLYAAASRVFTGPAQLLNVAKAVRNPLGLVTMLERQIQKLGRKLTQPQRNELLGLSKREIDAQRQLKKTAKAAEADFSEANEKAYVEARDRVGRANRDLQSFLHDVTPFSWSRLLIMTMQGNMLTPMSQMKNFSWNATFYPVRTLSDSVASALDFGYSTLTGKPRTIKAVPTPSQRETIAMWDGLMLATREMLTGPSNESYVRQETQRGFRPIRAWVQAWSGENMPRDENGRIRLTDRFKKIFEGTVGIPAEVMFRLLNFGDKPVRRGAEMRGLVEGAKLKGLKGRDFEKTLAFPDQATRSVMEAESKKAILVQENAVTKILSHIEREIGRIPRAGPALQVGWRILALYQRVPVNLVMTTLDFALPEWGMGRAFVRAMSGDRRGALQSVGTAMTGAMMYSAAAVLWKAGLISEPPDKDDKKKRSVLYGLAGPSRINLSGLARYMQGGDPAYRLGDDTRSYEFMAIAGAIFHIYTTGKAREEAIRIRRGQPDEEQRNFYAKYLEQRMASFPGLASFAMDQSFVASTNSFLEAIQDTSPESTKFQLWMQNVFRMVSSIPIPNTVETVARTQYEYIPELRGDTLGESLSNVWKFKLQMLPKDDRAIVKRGLFGEPIPRTPAGANPYIYHLIDVTKKEAKAPDAFKQSLLELYQATELPDVYPTPPERTVQRGGISVRLTPQDYNDLQAVVGQFRRQQTEPLVSRPDYLALTPIERVIVLKRIYERAGTAARNWFVARPEIQERYFQSPDRVIGLTPKGRVRQQQQVPVPAQ